MLRVHTDVFMKVYWYSINSVTTMVVTGGGMPWVGATLCTFPAFSLVPKKRDS